MSVSVCVRARARMRVCGCVKCVSVCVRACARVCVCASIPVAASPTIVLVVKDTDGILTTHSSTQKITFSLEIYVV